MRLGKPRRATIARRPALRRVARQVSDAVATLNYLFLGAAAPACLDGADSNDDGAVNLSDALTTLGFLFRGAEPPPAPGPRECGRDSTADELDCAIPNAGS